MPRGLLVLTLSAGIAVGMHASERGLPLGLDRHRPVPHENPLTAAKIDLGSRLFRERRLSRDGSRSCASCHDPRRAFSDGRTTGLGVGGANGDRNVPTLVNRAWGGSFFWDGRATTLEQQVVQPLLNARELGMTIDGVLAVARSRAYRPRFDAVFGDPPTFDHVAAALASYLRTIVSGNSPYDRYAAGESRATNADAQRGFELFGGKAGCTACHTGPLFTDEVFHNTGIAWRSGRLDDDGRARVSGAARDRGAFKTPTLREVSRTAPYMHDGSIAALDEVIDHYDRGGIRNPGLDPRLRPLGLTRDDRLALVAFLRSLAGTISDGY